MKFQFFEWRSFVLAHGPLHSFPMNLGILPADPTLHLYGSVDGETSGIHTQQHQSLPSLWGKPPELTHGHTTSHPTRSVSGSWWREGEQGPLTVCQPKGLGVRQQRCHFGGLWIWAFTGTAGKTRAMSNQSSDLSEKPASRAATIMHFRARYKEGTTGDFSPLEKSPPISRDSRLAPYLFPRPLPWWQLTGSSHPAAIPGPALHPAAAAGEARPAGTHRCDPRAWEMLVHIQQCKLLISLQKFLFLLALITLAISLCRIRWPISLSGSGPLSKCCAMAFPLSI